MQSTDSAKPPEKPHLDDHVELAQANARSGLLLFAVYFAAYALFMGLAAFKWSALASATPLGPNVAILYGFGLILGALLVAGFYMMLCNSNAAKLK